MSAVGMVSIAVGVVAVCGRVHNLVAPAASLRWFVATSKSSGRTRILGAFMLTFGVAMIWAGASEDSTLAAILSVAGWAMAGVAALSFVLFPRLFRATVEAMLPADESDVLNFVRGRALLGLIAGVLFIYFGVLAL